MPYVSVRVDLSDLDEDDLIDHLRSRGKLPADYSDVANADELREAMRIAADTLRTFGDYAKASRVDEARVVLFEGGAR